MTKVPLLIRTGCGYDVHMNAGGPLVGLVHHGPNMNPWGWTIGLGWHNGLPTLGEALDALLADPAFGVDVHSTASVRQQEGR